MRIGLAAIAFLLSAAGAWAQTPAVSEAKVTLVGTIDAQVTGKVATPGVVSAAVNQGTYHFVTNATTMEARKGLNFGFQYRLVGSPEGAKVAIRKVTIFPAPGVRNPKTGEVLTRDDYIEMNTVGQPLLKAYSIDNDWEAVPGDWVQQIWFGEQKLAEQTFTLTKP
jgi:hypothetical protein